jgi:hypothetical protein
MPWSVRLSAGGASVMKHLKEPAKALQNASSAAVFLPKGGGGTSRPGKGREASVEAGEVRSVRGHKRGSRHISAPWSEGTDMLSNAGRDKQAQGTARR